MQAAQCVIFIIYPVPSCGQEYFKYFYQYLYWNFLPRAKSMILMLKYWLAWSLQNIYFYGQRKDHKYLYCTLEIPCLFLSSIKIVPEFWCKANLLGLKSGESLQYFMWIFNGDKLSLVRSSEHERLWDCKFLTGNWRKPLCFFSLSLLRNFLLPRL